MNDTPLLLAIHELNVWLSDLNEFKTQLIDKDVDDTLNREIETLEGAITICRKHTNYDKPINKGGESE